MQKNKEMLESINNQFYAQTAAECSKYKTVVIYGAGKTAFILYKKMKELQVNINAFWVSDKTLNRNFIDEIPVYQMDEIQADKDTTLVLIGVSKHSVEEVEQILCKNGYAHYIKPDRDMAWGNLETARRTCPAIEVTTQIGCSVNCRYCPQNLLLSRYFAVNKNRKQRLSLEDYKKCLKNLPSDTIITFSGFCEPFLNPECADMLLFTAEHGNRMSLHTTLVGMTMEDFEKIKELPFENVLLHTPDKDHYANIPVTDTYLQVLDHMLDAKNEAGEPLIRVANCQSEPDERILKFIRNRVSFMNLQLIDRAGNIEKEEVAEHIAHKGKIVCVKSPDFQRNILLPDGSLVLCCMDFGLQHELGNLLYNNYGEIVNSKAMQEIKNNMVNGGNILCRRCSLARKV